MNCNLLPNMYHSQEENALHNTVLLRTILQLCIFLILGVKTPFKDRQRRVINFKHFMKANLSFLFYL